MIMRKILTIIIDHQYYNLQKVTHFTLIADKATEHFLSKNGMVVRYLHNSWNLFTTSTIAGLWIPAEIEDNFITLVFQLLPHNSSFYRTVEDTITENRVNCICNKSDAISSIATGCNDTTCQYYHIQNVSRGKMDWTVRLQFEAEFFLENDKSFTIKFNQKKVFWKYYIYSQSDLENLEIVDPQSRVHFIRDTTDTFDTGPKAIVFISDIQIPLSEKATQQFRLVVKKGGIERNLIKCLPTATASGLRFKDSEKKDLISTIFISI